MWNISKLSVTGFQMISDGLRSGHGVEEVVTISILQKVLQDNQAKAKLVTLDSVDWNTTFGNNPMRKLAHEKKMASKFERAEGQMSHLFNVDAGVVEHIQEIDPSFYKCCEQKKMEQFDAYADTVKAYNLVEEKEETQQYSPSTSIMITQTTRKNRKTVLLTGGAGFIGSKTCAELLKRGDNVVVVDELNDYYEVSQKTDNLEWLKRISLKSSGYFVFIKADICDTNVMKSLFETYKPTRIIHLAARAGVRASINDPLTYVHSNIRGTTTLLELAKSYGCEHFVYASSSSVYGGSKNEVFRESDVVDAPVSPYAATKKACELIASTYTHLYGIPTAGLRFFTVYGPRGRPDMAPYKFLHRIFNEITIDQYGDGTSERDYTYVSDIVDGILRACDRPLGCQVYNLGNGRPVTLKRFIKIASNCANKEAKINILPMQPGDVPRTCADISKASKLLGYHPKVKFEDGMLRTAEWYKATFMDCNERSM
jgi:UDP-glucuronate 4-epimerase